MFIAPGLGRRKDHYIAKFQVYIDLLTGGEQRKKRKKSREREIETANYKEQPTLFWLV